MSATYFTLHSFVQVTGLPPFDLKLCVYSVVLLLRNVDLERGLANGTRLLVLEIGDDVIKVKILSGTPNDEFFHGIRYIMRQRCIRYKDGHKIVMCQFPLVPAWTLTVHKSQGQSVERLGVYLPSIVFCHGQLYVALSRAMMVDQIRVYLGHGRIDESSGEHGTLNIVNRELMKFFLDE